MTENNNHRVQIFTEQGKFIHKFGSLGASDGKLKDPHGITMDKQGRILVADYSNNRVQFF